MSTEKSYFNKITGDRKINKPLVAVLICLIAVLLAKLVVSKGVMIPIMVMALISGITVLINIVTNTRFGLWLYLVYIFIMNGMIRHIPFDAKLGLLMEFILLMSWLGYVFQNRRALNFHRIPKDMGFMLLFWIGFNLLEFFNPVGPSPAGWFYEARTAFMTWMFVTPMVFMVLNTNEDFNRFFKIILLMSFFGFLYAFKQVTIGVDGMEQSWLDAGAHTTHVLWGKLRAFSFYSDAGQFGVSQAHLSIIVGVMALGAYSLKKRLIYGVLSLLFFYGMLIAGTRSALAVTVGGVFIYLIMTKRVKVIVLGLVLSGTAFGVLKYTSFMEGNAEIRRLRTALDPEDRSFQTRLRNQETLSNYLSNKPFGAGVGTIGEWGETYNQHLLIAHIPPDSLLVKQWGMYGIVGFIIWFSFMLYILGKGVGYAWKLQNPDLRQKIMALTAGNAGILMASFGQEAMNLMPTTAIITFGWGYIFLAPKLEKELQS